MCYRTVQYLLIPLGSISTYTASRIINCWREVGGTMASSEKLLVRNADGEIEIVGNRDGLKWLADVCLSMSKITDQEANTPANHYHIADYMNNAEEGSLPLIILCNPDL